MQIGYRFFHVFPDFHSSTLTALCPVCNPYDYSTCPTPPILSIDNYLPTRSASGGGNDPYA